MGSKVSTALSSVTEQSPASRPVYGSNYESEGGHSRSDSIFRGIAESGSDAAAGGAVRRQSSEPMEVEAGGSSPDNLFGEESASALGRGCGQVSRSDSTSSSMSSSNGLSNFLSNFNLWRSATGAAPEPGQRTRSMSRVLEPGSLPGGRQAPAGRTASTGFSTEQEESVLANPRAALARLLSGRSEERARSGSHSESGQRQRDSFSIRNLNFSTAHEFLTETSLTSLGLQSGRVYVTHSLPSHMWAVNGKQIDQVDNLFLATVARCAIVCTVPVVGWMSSNLISVDY